VNYVDFDKPVALIGAGQLGKMAIELWPVKLEKPIFFLDEFSTQEIDGIPIFRTSTHNPDPSVQYILSYFKTDPKEIKYLFESFLNQEIITIYDLLTQLNSDLFSNGWTGNPENLKNARSNSTYFADEHSQSIYSNVLDWRYLRKLNNSIPANETDKYNLTKFGRNSNHYDLVIDAGSYDFSFPKSLLASKITWESLIAIEPDPNSQKEVENQINQINQIQSATEILGNCHLEKRALWSNNEGARFYSNGLLAARISKNAHASCKKVETVTLKTLLEEQIVSESAEILTKLHVEGAEWPIIQSSSALLERNQIHDIVINLSHDEESLVKIPELLHNSGKYDLFLHSHALFGEGLTLFARSKGKL
jgi:FkbM family methyltransferase